MLLFEQTFHIKGRRLLPLVQGGMGIGISAHRLAGTVAKLRATDVTGAKLGAMGTIASVELRQLHPDLLARTEESRDNALVVEANLEALRREIALARDICGKEGFLAVNVMRAITEWKDHVCQACKSGVNAIVMGAGLPLDLLEFTREYPEVALIPIVSEARGVYVVLKRWMGRYHRRPDAIVVEHPGRAGGHLGAKNVAATADAKFDFPVVLPEVFGVFSDLGITKGEIPVIVAGGINSPKKIREVLALGASAVQIGTAFAVTEEGDAHPNFKQVLLDATPKDMRVFMSTAGLPARAVTTPWLEGYLKREKAIQGAHIKRNMCRRGVSCLSYCGLCDREPTTAGRFCIEALLANAFHGNVKQGICFRGSGQLPFSDIRSVDELIRYLLEMPEA
ncbi:MAG: nitronate monooxygenase family protein [bacterium]|nr:nitronate monooxygenase family protein [bacterium]